MSCSAVKSTYRKQFKACPGKSCVIIYKTVTYLLLKYLPLYSHWLYLYWNKDSSTMIRIICFQNIRLRELGWWNNGAVFRHISGTPSGQFLLTHRLTQKRKSVDVLSSYRYGSTIYLYNTTIISKPQSTTKKPSNLFLYDPTYYGLNSRKLPIKRNKDTVPSSYSSWRNFKKYFYRQTKRSIKKTIHQNHFFSTRSVTDRIRALYN